MKTKRNMKKNENYHCYAPGEVQLMPSLFKNRFDLNRTYLMNLKTENLLQPYLFEAGLGGSGQLRVSMHGTPGTGDDLHWGWESPTSQVRGHFLGHWISAAARIVATNGDMELKLKMDHIVAELGRCQVKNGGEWVFSIPEKYFYWTAAGKPTWAPHYVVHKTLMGLVDAYKYASNAQALTIVENTAKWFYRWTGKFSRKQMDDILDVETGGMLEVWADLYGITGSIKHKDLMERYTRSRLFDPLLEGKDVLTNMHANTTIPEIHGAVRAYEVTRDERWRKIVEKYWKCAVTDRGTYCTGGQTSGEIWTPPFEFAARRGDKNQEHCTVYNMIRLADILFRWTGDVSYCDYIERNIYNGILAQQHPLTGMITYFLPLEAGARKRWGSPTYDFWCCHGTLVQAHTVHNSYVYYGKGKEIVISQFVPSRLTTRINGKQVILEMTLDHQSAGSANDNSSAAGMRHRPTCWAIDIKVICESPTNIDLAIRIPWWVRGKPNIVLNGKPQSSPSKSPCFHTISRTWHKDRIRLELPKNLTISPVPDESDSVAFLDGPVVLAGLCDREYTLDGDKENPSSILVPDNERQWGQWLSGYRTSGQQVGIRFKPLNEIEDEPYTVYFPVKSR